MHQLRSSSSRRAATIFMAAELKIHKKTEMVCGAEVDGAGLSHGLAVKLGTTMEREMAVGHEVPKLVTAEQVVPEPMVGGVMVAKHDVQRGDGGAVSHLHG